MKMPSRSLRVPAVLLLLCALVAVAPAAAQGPAATVDDLAWMTGTWRGALGPNTLEETWSEPRSGSIAALVRMTTAEATAMVELIVIEQDGDSLVLRVQQWNPGFAPRTDGPQTLRLKEIGEKSVNFEAVEDGGMKELGYSSPADGEFVIDILTAQGGALKIELEAVE